ncbi:MAG: helix-turn-helix transcriptional regulator [Clostridia bacterium]|jgi:transcriptional regulator with XRE-family HTH domain|nr:helix-turn-helix transcriptional regulator [Clostridia bacterium]
MDIFAIRLNKLIKENKITKYRLAVDLNSSKQSVCNWCDGTSEPKLTYIRLLAQYFQVSADYLLGLEDESGAKISFKNNDNS